MTNASPPSSLVDVGQLAAALERFAAERNWAQFHSPKNLVMALTGEVGELSEIFQWMDEEQSKDAARHPDTAQAVQDELATYSCTWCASPRSSASTWMPPPGRSWSRTTGNTR